MSTTVDLVTRLPMNADAQAHLFGVIQTFEDMRAAVPLSELLVREVSASPIRFMYRITHTDGRVWRQFFDFSSYEDRDPAQEFTVAPGWRLSEFSFHRIIRDHCVGLINTAMLDRLSVEAPVA